MSGVIKMLPDAIANQIAAGEVVRRPSSVVKELLENAIDAGGTSIKLIVKDAGSSLIQVVDNGKGMSEEDARLCFERHATSKISEATDLFAIKTLGFRGEALASIAAVAQVELRTRQAGSEVGTRVVVEGSVLQLQEPCQCPVGTSIAVKNIFYNIPARRKFLKSPKIENRHVLDEFQRVALSNANLSFSYFSNGSEIFRLPGSNLRRRIVGILGRTFNERLIPVEEEADFLRIYGFIGKPEFSRRSRGDQFFFVNNRFIRSNYLHHAVSNAYEGLLSEKSYPLYILFIDIDPERIDINVHPNKQEIKFDDERVIYQLLLAAIKRSLGTFSLTPMLDFDRDVNLTSGSNSPFDTPPVSKTPDSTSPFNRSTPTMPPTSRDSNSSSGGGKGGGHSSNSPFNRPQIKRIPSNWQDLYKTEEVELPISKEELIPPPVSQSEEVLETSKTITLQSQVNKQPVLALGEVEQFAPLQLHSQYILYQIKSGFILVDQQAAHERILYEKYQGMVHQSKIPSQQLLFPSTIELPRADALLLKDILPDINALGYDIRAEGEEQFVVYGIPADISKVGEEQQVIEHLIEQYQRNTADLQLDRREQLLCTLAYGNSIKKGQRLSVEEMQALIDQLFACKAPYASPRGKRTLITYHLEEIEKLFGG